MEIIYKNVDDLIPYEKNPRKNSKAVGYVANSIEEFGFKVPIVIDSQNVVVCGHTRLLACKKLNICSVPCIVADDLTDEQIKAFRLADNKVAEKAVWDFDLLNEEIDDILSFDMSDFGFDIFSMDDINELDGYNEKEDEREHFSKTFVFPIEKKKQIICYLKKHQNEIVEQIIKESENDD